jgi:hypothetical protein
LSCQLEFFGQARKETLYSVAAKETKQKWGGEGKRRRWDEEQKNKNTRSLIERRG